MKLPLLGPVSLTGFQNAWFFLFLLVVLLLIGIYVVQQFARRRRVLRFANMEVLRARRAPSSRPVAPRADDPAGHIVGAADHGNGRADVRHPDPAQPCGRDVGHRRFGVDGVHRCRRRTGWPPRRWPAKQFADELTPAINLGLVEFAANATLLVAPTTNRGAVKAAIDGLQALPKTATGEGIFTALQAIATVGSVMGGGDGPPPARIVLESDGAENVPLDPNAPQGAFTAARAAKAEGVQISTISFGTPYGTVEYRARPFRFRSTTRPCRKSARSPTARRSTPTAWSRCKDVYSTLQRQIGYETVKGDASLAWMLLGAVVLAGAVLAGLFLNRRLPA